MLKLETPINYGCVEREDATGLGKGIRNNSGETTGNGYGNGSSITSGIGSKMNCGYGCGCFDDNEDMKWFFS